MRLQSSVLKNPFVILIIDNYFINKIEIKDKIAKYDTNAPELHLEHVNDESR